MTLATVIMQPNTNGVKCWDLVSVAIQSADRIVPMIRFKDRADTIGTFHDLLEAHYAGHEGDLNVEANGQSHTLSHDVWTAIGNSLEEWYDEYCYLVGDIFELEGTNDSVVAPVANTPVLRLV